MQVQLFQVFKVLDTLDKKPACANVFYISQLPQIPQRIVYMVSFLPSRRFRNNISKTLINSLKLEYVLKRTLKSE